MKDRTDLIDDDGENRAVRAFLSLYQNGATSVREMVVHMAHLGWSNNPAWVIEALDEPLTKGGAQLWIRHLFALEKAKPVAAPHARDAVAWTPDTGYVFADTKPVVVPDDAIDWEGVAADQAMTIAMMQVDAEQDKKDADRYRWLREHTAITDGGVDTSMKENTP